MYINKIDTLREQRTNKQNTTSNHIYTRIAKPTVNRQRDKTKRCRSILSDSIVQAWIRIYIHLCELQLQKLSDIVQREYGKVLRADLLLK